MADVLNELKNLLETLQNRNTSLPKAHILLIAFSKRIESLIASPDEHPILSQRAKKATSFQEVELSEGKIQVINQAQSIKKNPVINQEKEKVQQSIGL